MIKTTTLTRIILATSIMLLTNMSCSNSEEQQRARQSRQNRQSPIKNSMLVKQTDTTKLDTIQPVKIDTNQLANVNTHEITIPAEINTVDVNSNYIRVENTKHKNCQYYEEIDFILKSKLQLHIEQQNKPVQYFSQWTLDLFDIRYTRNEVIEYYENKINQELEIMIKSTKFNFKNVDVNKPIISSK